MINAEWGGAAPRRTMGGQGEHDGDLLQFTLNPLRGKRADDLRKQESFLDVLEMGSLQYRSCIAVAVGIRDVNEVAGLLVAVSPEPKAFAETGLEALRLLAGIPAAALAQARAQTPRHGS
ncbi:hypothetical protein LUW74_14940 [Actinomadura madurae]|uniref:hypothetical protein n=1 Tax=Actinomadura madurae TaxID=1993 RepID=UPI00202725EB|nr:hypothetical protein [Actinomadura madurae]URN04478.1 hypothetical protein LUW74_14940 [Actinomadura madurae]